MSKLALLSSLASTLYMTGVIWFVQVVHYPLFDRVSIETFRRYHADHTRTTTFVVLVPMVVELLSSAWLVRAIPLGSPPWLAWLGLLLTMISWGVTFFWSVPAHARLAAGFEPQVHRWLVATNFVRVASWSTHSIVLLIMTSRALD